MHCGHWRSKSNGNVVGRHVFSILAHADAVGSLQGAETHITVIHKSKCRLSAHTEPGPDPQIRPCRT